MDNISSLKNCFSVIVITALSLIGCDKPLSAEEKKQQASTSIGVIASISAGFLVSAARYCQAVGVPDIDQCAAIEGNLLAEQYAQIQANLAVEQRISYWKGCQADFSTEYCDQLIKRAIAIELRMPKPTGE